MDFSATIQPVGLAQGEEHFTGQFISWTMVESFVVSFCKMQLVLFCWFYISIKKIIFDIPIMLNIFLRYFMLHMLFVGVIYLISSSVKKIVFVFSLYCSLLICIVFMFSISCTLLYCIEV